MPTIYGLVQNVYATYQTKFTVGAEVPNTPASPPSVTITRIEETPGKESYDVYVNDAGTEKLQARVPMQEFYVIYNL